MRCTTGMRVTLLAALFTVTPPSIAGEDRQPGGLFSVDDELHVTLSAPWRTLRRKVEDDRRYPATMAFTGTDGRQHTLNVEVAPRGLTRRLKVCKFPPLKIHFDKQQAKDTEFRGNGSLKMVTHCDNHRKYEQYYIKEYLAYRIYNLLTEYSFRVRALEVEYRDSERRDSVTRFAFLIEDPDEVAERNGLKKLDLQRISYKRLEPGTTAVLALFQYLIGNLDWAATAGPAGDRCCHNSRLLGAGPDAEPIYVVPYDFDSAGIVDAHYAMPPDGLNVRNIRQRLYRGFCPLNDHVPAAVALFNEQRDEIVALFEDDARLSDKNRRASLDYIADFYETINDPEQLEERVTGKCRG